MTTKRKIPVALSEELLRGLDKFRGIMGDSYPEIIRNIVISYLSDKTFLKGIIEEKERPKDSTV